MNVRQRTIWIALIIIVIGPIGCSTGLKQKPQNIDATVKVDMTNVLSKDFLGAGIQCSGYPWFNVSDADWQKVFKRLDYIKMPFTRVMVDWTSFFEGLDGNGNPKYIFESQKMRNTYKLLDYCQANNIRVMFGHWGWTNTALHAKDQNWDIKPDSKLHAKMSADLIDYVVNKKGYSCIVWFDPINEPDGGWSSCDGDWELWTRVAKRLNKEIVKRGLDKKIRISGPADVFRGWIPNALEDKGLRKFLAAYNEHRYLRNKSVVSGEFEQKCVERVRVIKEKDPGKPYFAGEVGFLDGKNQNDQQVEVKNFWYGVSMADAAIQMMRAGMDGFLAWYLDDAMHWAGDSDGPLAQPDNAYERRKIWGMWNIVGAENGMPEDEALRPLFYTWSQLSRNFPAGCQTLNTDASGVDMLRVASARIPAGNNKYHLSFAAVNNSDESRTVRIVVPKAGQNVTLSMYEYFDANNDNKVDAWPNPVDIFGKDVLPSPTKVLNNVDLTEGLIVALPSKGVVIMTTLEAGSAIPIK